MNIEQKLFGAGEPSTLVEFAEKHNLTLRVTEREDPPPGGRYFVAFKRVEVMVRGMLAGSYGDGDTIEQATIAYAKQIAGKRIAVGAYTDHRVNLEVPNDFRHVVKT